MIKCETSIITDIYFKSTDSKQCLNFNSCHPKTTKTIISFSLARRICTIISDSNILKIRLQELATTLRSRHYPDQVIKTGSLKAIKIPRNTLLNTHKEVGINITPFISTYNPKNREVFGILKANMNIFKQDNTMNRIMKHTKFIKGKRQLPNLSRILMKSELNENNTPPCVSKCNEPRCGLWKSIIRGSCLKSKEKNFSCKRKFEVHCKKCSLCNNMQLL